MLDNIFDYSAARRASLNFPHNSPSLSIGPTLGLMIPRLHEIESNLVTGLGIRHCPAFNNVQKGGEMKYFRVLRHLCLFQLGLAWPYSASTKQSLDLLVHPLPVDVVTGGLGLVLAVPGPYPDLPLGPALPQPLHRLGQVEQLGEREEIRTQAKP